MAVSLPAAEEALDGGASDGGAVIELAPAGLGVVGVDDGEAEERLGVDLDGDRRPNLAVLRLGGVGAGHDQFVLALGSALRRGEPVVAAVGAGGELGVDAGLDRVVALGAGDGVVGAVAEPAAVERLGEVERVAGHRVVGERGLGVGTGVLGLLRLARRLGDGRPASEVLFGPGDGEVLDLVDEAGLALAEELGVHPACSHQRRDLGGADPSRPPCRVHDRHRPNVPGGPHHGSGVGGGELGARGRPRGRAAHAIAGPHRVGVEDRHLAGERGIQLAGRSAEDLEALALHRVGAVDRVDLDQVGHPPELRRQRRSRAVGELVRRRRGHLARLPNGCSDATGNQEKIENVRLLNKYAEQGMKTS